MYKFLLIPVVVLVALFNVIGSSASSVVAVHVVMHDPGCHSFLVGNKMLNNLTVKGRAKLYNYDEGSLVIKKNNWKVIEPVGSVLVLDKGSYTITMVHQMKTDNTLKLTIK